MPVEVSNRMVVSDVDRDTDSNLSEEEEEEENCRKRISWSVPWASAMGLKLTHQ